jgi:hypothetical protein
MPTSKSPDTNHLLTLKHALPTDRERPLEEFAQSAASDLPSEEAVRQRMIAELAYRRAEQRGFEPGHELDDWLAAETEIVSHSLQRTSTTSV